MKPRFGRSFGWLLSAALLPIAAGCGGGENAGSTVAGSGGSPGVGDGSVESGGNTPAGTETGGAPAAGGAEATGGSGQPSGGSPAGGSVGSAGAASEPDCIGWASMSAVNVNGTTGGGQEPVIDVSTTAEFASNAAGTTPRVLRLAQSMTGSVGIGSNKTILGSPGVVFTGHLQITGSSNVILKNLKVVGNNCTDSPTDCSAGEDAVSVNNGAHHICITHCDISDGSDGNLDLTQASDYMTVAWTKFSYSSLRSGGHMFSNLIGADDAATGDTGHLNTTFHHNWWADNVNQRMPRVRFGQVHLFNNFYTSTNSSYCVGVGVNANIRLENNAFNGVRDPIDTTNYSNAQSVVASSGNLYTNTAGNHPDLNPGAVFTPPYAYSLEDASTVEAAVRSGAGTQ